MIIGVISPKPPGSFIFPISGFVSPNPLSLIVKIILSIRPSLFKSISVAPSSQVDKFWSSKNTNGLPSISFFI